MPLSQSSLPLTTSFVPSTVTLAEGFSAAAQEQNSMITVINTAVSFNVYDFIDISMPPIVIILII